MMIFNWSFKEVVEWDTRIFMWELRLIQIFADKNEQVEIDNFTAAVGFEILEDSLAEAVQFAKDFVECEGKEYLKVVK